MRVTIHQPGYIPWLGLMSKIQNADMYVCLNHVQYEKNYVDNRNKILLNNKEEWLTIPVETSGKFKHNPLNEAKIANSGKDWKMSHLNKILKAYPHGDKAFIQQLRDMYKMESDKLFDYQDYSIRVLIQQLHINTPVIYSANMGLKKKKSDLVLEICQMLNATEYLSGPFGREYLDKEKFKKAGIKILYHNWDINYKLSSIHYILSYDGGSVQALLRENSKVIDK